MMNFFGPNSPYLDHPLLTADRTAAEVDHLVVALGLEPGAAVLDVGCGFGRHCLEFARRGFRPTGVDPSQTMIEAARASAEAEELEVPLVVSEDPAAAAVDEGFDAAVAMFTTVGQVGGDGRDNVAAGLLGSVARLLRPGARLVVEVPQRDAAVQGLVAAERFGDRDGEGDRTEISRRFDRDSSQVVERFEVITNGAVQRFDLAYRLFDAKELEQLLLAAGFVDVAVCSEVAALAAAVDKHGAGLAAAGCSAARLDRDATTMVLMATNGRQGAGRRTATGS